MIKFQVQMPDGKMLFSDDFEVEDIGFEGSVIYAQVDNLHYIDFDNWKRTYRDYTFVNGERKLKAVTIFY